MSFILDHQLREQLHHISPEFPITFFHDEIADLPTREGPVHWHPEFEIVTAQMGVLDYQVGEEHILLNAGDSIFVNANMLHSIKQISGETADPMPGIVFLGTLIAPEGSVVYQKYIQKIAACDEIPYGWQRGNDVIPMLCGLDRGYAVVSVQYRLSGEARFPAAVYDAKAALRYLRNHAEEYGLDSSRISLWGASAGAWLAAFTAVTIGNPAFEDLTHGPGGDFAPRVRCAVSWCGVLDMSNPGPAPATKEALDKDARSPFSVFLGAPTTTVPQLCRLASPITYVNACSTPPFMLVHGTGDELVPVQQSLSMAQRLKDCCGEGYAELLIENDRPHHGDSWLHEPWVIERCLDFIDRHSGTRGQ